MRNRNEGDELRIVCIQCELTSRCAVLRSRTVERGEPDVLCELLRVR